MTESLVVLYHSLFLRFLTYYLDYTNLDSSFFFTGVPLLSAQQSLLGSQPA